MEPLFVFSVEAIGDMLAHATGVFADMNTLLVVAVALPLGFWGVRKVIGLFRFR